MSPPDRDHSAPTADVLDSWHALDMIREALEMVGRPGTVMAQEEVLAAYGPEPVHEAEALVDAILKLGDRTSQMP